MNPTASATPSATPAPITDIVSPFGYFPYPWWVVAIAGVLLLALIGFACWWFFIRRKPKHILTVREQSLLKLEELRPRIEDTDPYAFGITVSDVLRYFIEKQYGLAATTQTSLEFLNAIRDRDVFKDEEKAAIALFLEKADLIKFAHMKATSQDSESLLDTALMLVRGGDIAS